MNESKRVVGIQAVAEHVSRGKEGGRGIYRRVYELPRLRFRSRLWISLLSLANSQLHTNMSRHIKAHMLDPNTSQ